MIVLALASAAAVAASSPNNEEMMHRTQKMYRECVLNAAIRMEKSDESAFVIADASIGSCGGLRATAQVMSALWLNDQYHPAEYRTAQKAAESALKTSDAELKQEAIAAVLIRRADRAKLCSK